MRSYCTWGNQWLTKTAVSQLTTCLSSVLWYANRRACSQLYTQPSLPRNDKASYDTVPAHGPQWMCMLGWFQPWKSRSWLPSGLQCRTHFDAAAMQGDYCCCCCYCWWSCRKLMSTDVYFVTTMEMIDMSASVSPARFSLISVLACVNNDRIWRASSHFLHIVSALVFIFPTI